MKRVAVIIALVFALTMAAGTAMAVPGTALQGVLDSITVAPVAGDSSVDVTNDFLADDVDSYWNITASGGSVATLIIELAGYANSNAFGVYNNGVYVELFKGEQSAGAQAMLSIKADGSVFVNGSDTGFDFTTYTFGYYLDSPDGLFFSDTSLNEDKTDHMFAYQGTNTDTVELPGLASGLWTNNEYILAFEDLWEGGDLDYTDFVVMVESVNPVPEPSIMLLLGCGLLGLALRKRSA